jgi:hypothetical protein
MEEAFAISIKDTDIYQREQLVLSQVNFQLINGEFCFSDW